VQRFSVPYFVMMSDGMRRAALILALAFTAAAAGCGGNGDDEAPTWSGPPRPSEDGTVAVDGFNDYADEVEGGWERSPLRAAGEFLALQEPNAANSSMVMAGSGGEIGSTVTVTVLLDGLLDDSIRTQRYVLGFERRDDGTWRLVSARFAQRCQPGRGHQDFSPADCL
jgi:hypothetical protein